jgi:hypothetical protein
MAMKDADATIERLLVGLRDAEPPRGMERRILEALDGFEDRRVASAAFRWLPAMALLLGCGVILTALVVVRAHRPTPADSSRPRFAASLPTKTPKPIPLKVTPVPPRRTPRPQVRHAEHVAPAAETQASSFPAPPLPLTEQEKLLLRLARGADPGNVAMLNPEVRAAHTEEAKKEFQHFFEISAVEMRSQSE